MGDSKGKNQRSRRTGNEYVFWLVTEYAVRQDVTGQLKTKYQFFWFQKVNNILSCVREIIENEIIYS